VHHFRALMLIVTSITEGCSCRKLKSTSFEHLPGLDSINFTKKKKNCRLMQTLGGEGTQLSLLAEYC
jgi:hypothetical protein